MASLIKIETRAQTNYLSLQFYWDFAAELVTYIATAIRVSGGKHKMNLSINKAKVFTIIHLYSSGMMPVTLIALAPLSPVKYKLSAYNKSGVLSNPCALTTSN